ncbi:Imm43 family immunity protein [Marinigracilibium pacificum]|uniref:Immunity MXAN-0049 protein domain-containing protein n=1 Tax=Marinigracilibium pacificum TaxID=2729599 RepID=A0A848J2E4_9BACT|nr:DUF1629 domain-containing protein [Marinigracilibium pacificum]NMM50767.1 hypothetical protein [Marinigracilibium pacificum]
MKLENKVYKLNWGFNHSGDSEKDAFHIPFKNNMEFSADMMSVREFELPERLYLQANFRIIENIDYPLTDLNIQIISKRILDIINELGGIKHRQVPITMIDDTFLDELFDKQGELKPNVPTNNDFVGIQLMEYTDVFDYDKSEYEEDFILPVGHISKLILKKPKYGFPPIFKLKECSSEVFISEQTYNRMKNENIRGFDFEEIEVS